MRRTLATRDELRQAGTPRALMNMPIFANIIQEAFSPLISLFESVLVFVHNDLVGGSWGFAIVGLTVVVRAIMVPLTLRQLRSMQKMQMVAPQLKALQAKYKDDKQRQNEEVMKFYRENGVNPFGACLPLLLQLPVFISLFYMLRTDLKKRICGTQLVHHYNQVHSTALHAASALPSKFVEKTTCNQVAPHAAKFLFLPDITAKATGVTLVVLIALYVGSQVTSTLMMSASAPAGSKGMMLALPFVFVAILYRYPAGLLVYWITTNLWTVGQQYFVRRTMGTVTPPPSGKGGDTPDDPPQNGKSSGLLGKREPALAGVSTGASSAPPPSPRKKKKRSGRRR
jgi:YidC/Oxa1 family membrane protein insertase